VTFWVVRLESSLNKLSVAVVVVVVVRPVIVDSEALAVRLAVQVALAASVASSEIVAIPDRYKKTDEAEACSVRTPDQAAAQTPVASILSLDMEKLLHHQPAPRLRLMEIMDGNCPKTKAIFQLT